MHSAMVRSRVCPSEGDGSDRYLNQFCQIANASISVESQSVYSLMADRISILACEIDERRELYLNGK